MGGRRGEEIPNGGRGGAVTTKDKDGAKAGRQAGTKEGTKGRKGEGGVAGRRRRGASVDIITNVGPPHSPLSLSLASLSLVFFVFLTLSPSPCCFQSYSLSLLYASSFNPWREKHQPHLGFHCTDSTCCNAMLPPSPSLTPAPPHIHSHPSFPTL